MNALKAFIMFIYIHVPVYRFYCVKFTTVGFFLKQYYLKMDGRGTYEFGDITSDTTEFGS